MTAATLAPAVEPTTREQIEDLAIREINTPDTEAEITVALARLAGHLAPEDRAFWFGELQAALVDQQKAHDGDIPAGCDPIDWPDFCDYRIDEALKHLTGDPR